MRHTILISSLVLLASSSFLRAQVNPADVDRFNRVLDQLERDQRLQANPSIPADQRTFIDYGAFTTLQWLSLDDPQNHNHAFFQEDLTGYTHIVFDSAQEVFLRGRLFHRDFNPGDRFSSDGKDIDGRVERAYYRFDLANYYAAYKGQQIDGDLSIKLGRDLVYWANGLTLNSEMDGGVIDVSRGPFSLEMIAGITPLDTPDFDSSRPNFDSRNKRGLFGAMASMKAGDQHPFIYVLDQRDFNDKSIEPTASDPTAIPTDFDYNSFYIGVGSQGALTDRMSYGAEAVYEGGRSISRSSVTNAAGGLTAVPQAHDPIQAYAFDGRIDYAIPDEHATRFSIETIFASGDHDRNSTTNTVGGNKGGSDDRAFNALGLLNVGVAFVPPVSNLMVLRVGASTFPLPEHEFTSKLQIGTDLFWFGKANSEAPIDEPTNNSTYLGVEPDIYLNWGLTSDLTFAIRYGVFVPGEGIAGDRKARQFFYTGLTFAF